MWDHMVLPATRHKWTRPALTPASKLVLVLTPERWKVRVDLDYRAMHRPEVELAISRPRVRRPNHYATEPPTIVWYARTHGRTHRRTVQKRYASRHSTWGWQRHKELTFATYCREISSVIGYQSRTFRSHSFLACTIMSEQTGRDAMLGQWPRGVVVQLSVLHHHSAHGGTRWWFGLAVTRWSRSTKLLYARPG